jgi:hypothetical protein
MYPKVRLAEKTKGGGQRRKERQTSHLCGNKTQGNTQNSTGWGQGKECPGGVTVTSAQGVYGP